MTLNGENDRNGTDDNREDESTNVNLEAPEEEPGPSLEEIAEQAAQVTRDILAHFPRVPDPVVSWNIEEGSVWVEIEGDPPAA